MRTLIDSVLIIGFLVVDFLFFHDFFKAGEMITLPQYLTGALSVLVMVRAGWSLLSREANGYRKPALEHV